MSEPTASGKTSVRTKFRPDEVIEVDEVELAILKGQGLLYEGQATTDDGARLAVEKEQGAPPRTSPPRKRASRSKKQPAGGTTPSAASDTPPVGGEQSTEQPTG